MMICFICKEDKSYFGEMQFILLPGGEHRGKMPVCHTCLGWSLKPGDEPSIGHCRLLALRKYWERDNDIRCII